MADDALRVTLLVTRALELLGIACAVGGSLASSMHGVMRSTLDADILADIPPEKVTPFLAALQPAFYADESMIREAIDRRGSFNLVHFETAFKVDIFLPKTRTFDRNQLRRSAPAQVADDPDCTFRVISAEDVVLAKLEWYRMGGGVSDRQWRDLLGVLKVQSGRLDLDYLRAMARELAVEDLLERALREA